MSDIHFVDLLILIGSVNFSLCFFGNRAIGLCPDHKFLYGIHSLEPVFTTPIYERMIADDDSINAYTEHMDVMLMETKEDVKDFIDELAEKYTAKPPLLVVLLGNSSYV